MKKIYILLAATFLYISPIIAQSVSSIYSADVVKLNPSLVGLQPDYTLTAYSEQSFSTKALSEQTLRFASPILNRGGVLVDIQRSSRNITNQFQTQVAYAHHIFINEKLSVNVALGGFYLNNSLNQSNLHDFERLDPLITSYSSTNQNQYGGRFAFSLRSSRLLFGGDVLYNVVNKSYLYSAVLGYDCYVSPSFVFVPLVSVKNEAMNQVIPGVGASLWFKKCVWISADVSRTSSASAGCFISKFLFLSYTYKASSSALWMNTHTFSLGLKLGKSMFNGVISSGDKSAPYYEWEKK